MEVSLEPSYAAANVFPSVEHVVERSLDPVPISKEMAQTGLPVWRSQLASPSS